MKKSIIPYITIVLLVLAGLVAMSQYFVHYNSYERLDKIFAEARNDATKECSKTLGMGAKNTCKDMVLVGVNNAEVDNDSNTGFYYTFQTKNSISSPDADKYQVWLSRDGIVINTALQRIGNPE